MAPIDAYSFDSVVAFVRLIDGAVITGQPRLRPSRYKAIVATAALAAEGKPTERQQLDLGCCHQWLGTSS